MDDLSDKFIRKKERKGQTERKKGGQPCCEQGDHQRMLQEPSGIPDHREKRHTFLAPLVVQAFQKDTGKGPSHENQDEEGDRSHEG